MQEFYYVNCVFTEEPEGKYIVPSCNKMFQLKLLLITFVFIFFRTLVSFSYVLHSKFLKLYLVINPGTNCAGSAVIYYPRESLSNWITQLREAGLLGMVIPFH